MKKLTLLLLFLSSSCFADMGRINRHERAIQDEFDNVYNAIRQLNPHMIWLQTGNTFYINNNRTSMFYSKESGTITIRAGGIDEVTISGTGGISSIYGLHHDRGDPVNKDFSTGDFDIDGSSHTLDLSGIIPVGAKTVLIRVGMSANTININLSMSKAGNTNFRNNNVMYSQVANQFMQQDVILAVDADRKIKYTATIGITTIEMTVGGWWK